MDLDAGLEVDVTQENRDRDRDASDRVFIETLKKCRDVLHHAKTPHRNVQKPNIKRLVGRSQQNSAEFCCFIDLVWSQAIFRLCGLANFALIAATSDR